ncbi:MAG: hypothetical protein L3J74_02990 [Bacteroidales bacterium]|nr:hypothetical protein [Bacteroidales bacterium]
MNIKQNFKYLILFSCFFISMGITAQEEQKSSDFNSNINADFVSRYIWRGQKLSETPAIQPAISVDYKGFTIGTWASYSFGYEPVQEIDLYLSYNTGNFTFTLYDYFYPNNSLTDYVDYFDWNKETTQHWLEAIIEVGNFENLPLNLLVGVFFTGADIDANLNNQYSTYIEFSYDFNVQNVDAQLFAGFTPFAAYYSDGFNFVNIGLKASKEIKISDKFSLPLSGAFIINPAKKNVMFQAVVTL